ncbi:MAG TPA: proton-conducting transporter membrane subunit [Reyranella sp.]|jgi:formate hydrogenlyase subunit 3/multisubunit Na+/H+ antiporter MnhD subunit|nr:proton-conducting transporter membrane subunit [Reyranella sp.]
MNDAGTLGSALLVATLATPLALLLACLSRRLRDNMPTLLVLAPLPGLAAALLAIGGTPLAFDQPQLKISLALDVPGALLLGVAALLWSAAGVYAFASLRGQANNARFAGCWLLTLTGSLGVFIAADLLGFYLVFALVSLPAYGLIVHDDDDAARRAGGVYMAFTVLGEAFLLMGFVLLAAGEPSDSLQIRDVVAALPQSPWRDAALVFTVAGFALKIGTVPAHGWMPLTYAAAPIPAASVLSGAAVKAGVIGLIRFLPFDTAMPGAGETLVALGFISAFYGVAIGITQANPKTVLAYSSVSQMGVIAAVLGMGLAAGDQGVALDTAFYAATHVLAKGALFLAVGVVAVTAARRLRPTLVLAAVLALGLGGLPLTGGALAKLAVKVPLGDGVVGLLANLSAVGTTLLMLHFLQRLTEIAPQDQQASASAGRALPWQAMALASIAVPWLLYPFAGGAVADALTANALFDALWPVLMGTALAFALRRWGSQLPHVPAGDVVGAAERAFRASYLVGAASERADGQLRQWPAAGLSLLAIAVVLGAAALFGH